MSSQFYNFSLQRRRTTRTQPSDERIYEQGERIISQLKDLMEIMVINARECMEQRKREAEKENKEFWKGRTDNEDPEGNI